MCYWAHKFYDVCKSITSESWCVGVAGDYQRNLFVQQQARQRQGDLAAAQRRGQPYTSILPLPRGTSNTTGTYPFDAAQAADYGPQDQFNAFRGQGIADVYPTLESRPPSWARSEGYGGHLSALNNVRYFNDGPPTEVIS